MGHTTKLSDYELERATTSSPDLEGDEAEVKAKVAAPEKKEPVKKTAATTK